MVPVDLLHETPLFSGCTEQDFERLGKIVQVREFQDGQLLFAHGEEARELMVIASGSIQLEFPVSVLGHRRDIAFETMGRGNVVGWSALTRINRFTLSGRAVGKTAVLAFRYEHLSALFDLDYRFAFQVMKNTLSIVRRRLERTHAMWTREIQQGLDERYR
jgi:CRP-like cAMP-binding protein